MFDIQCLINFRLNEEIIMHSLIIFTLSLFKWNVTLCWFMCCFFAVSARKQWHSIIHHTSIITSANVVVVVLGLKLKRDPLNFCFLSSTCRQCMLELCRETLRKIERGLRAVFFVVGTRVEPWSSSWFVKYTLWLALSLEIQVEARVVAIPHRGDSCCVLRHLE